MSFTVRKYPGVRNIFFLLTLFLFSAGAAMAQDGGVATTETAPYSAYDDPALFARIQGGLPRWAVKTNLLYAATALTPNVAFEAGLTTKSTLEVGAGWNQWNYRGSYESNRKLLHVTVRPEYRWWLCERFDGHFLGAHAFFSRFNIGGYNVPFLPFEKEFRYDGHAFGAGITYGYHWGFARRWGAELLLGMGVARLKYKRYGCGLCADMIDRPGRTYFGPTRAGVSLVYLIR